MTKISALLTALFLFSCYSPDRRNDTPHEITRSDSINRPKFELKYPADWTIDSTAQDYNMNSLFSLHPPSADGYTLFFLYNRSVDEELHISNQVKDRLNTSMKNGIVSYFDHWGIYIGHGAKIRGKLSGIFEGELIFFCHSTDSSSFLAASQCLDRDSDVVSPGLKFIARSFKLKN